jgi:cytochrome c-type biogenesis protein CcmH/NrfG
MMPRLILAILLCCGLAACEPHSIAVHELSPAAGTTELDAMRKWAGSQQPMAATQRSSDETLPSVDSMLTGLEKRLAAAPNDLKGWTLLATSYAYVGRLDDARRAQKTAVALGADPNALEQQILAAHTGANP